jgi:alkaline phosphatase D
MPTRRQFLARSGAVAAATVLAPQEGLAAKRRERRPANMLRGGHFRQGVLSGDPAPHAITLLTIVDAADRAGRVRLEVARDPDFRHVVARRDILTTAAVNHSVKARVTGLKPHRRYWYRFETRDRHSPVGRFQTALPPDSRAPVRFGFFSCASYTAGYYNAYELLAREDLDFVVCLGDYIYAETYHDVASGTAVRDDGIGRPNPHYDWILSEAGTLPEYRAKYALYRSDPALRRLHATHPVVAVWDDHEVQNNYANGAPDGGLTLRADFSRARRDAAYQAFFESMPVFPQGRSRIYRSQRHGRTVELTMLDARQYRDNQPCRDRIAHPCGSWDRPRSLLGGRQLSYLEGRLSASKAAWKVIGGQSLMMPNRVHDGQFTRFDSWQGYPHERAPAAAHPPDRHQRRRVHRRRRAHVRGRRRLCRHGLRPAGGAGVRRGLGDVRQRRREQLPHARWAADPGQSGPAVGAPRGDGALSRAQPVVRPARPRPPRLRHRRRLAGRLRRDAQAALDRQGAQLRHAAHDGLPLAGQARPTLDPRDRGLRGRSPVKPGHGRPARRSVRGPDDPRSTTFPLARPRRIPPRPAAGSAARAWTP